MTDTLKARLDALSDAATGGHWQVDLKGRKAYSRENGWALLSRNSDSEANLRLSSELTNAYRSGDIVTKEQLEQAVRDEREACAKVAIKCRTHFLKIRGEGHSLNSIEREFRVDNLNKSRGCDHVADAIRARTEGENHG